MARVCRSGAARFLSMIALGVSACSRAEVEPVQGQLSTLIDRVIDFLLYGLDIVRLGRVELFDFMIFRVTGVCNVMDVAMMVFL